MKVTPLSVLVRLMIAFYFPFLGLLAMGVVALMGILVVAALGSPVAMILVILAVLMLIPLAHVGWVVLWMLLRKPRPDQFEMKVSRKKLARLYELVDDVARKRRLPEPDEVRLGAGSVAHVYEDRDGQLILVLGGVAVAAFTQKALAGVVAHELGHFGAGDTRLLRQALVCNAYMAVLEGYCSEYRFAYLNPLMWGILLYHLLYHLAWAGLSRQQEFDADRHAVEAEGAGAASALVLTEVAERLPWARMITVVEMCVRNGDPVSRVFAEQARLTRSASSSEWEDALRKVLKEPTGLFDSHPCLKERLKAMGVSAKKALRLALDGSGSPARDLIDDWDRVEAELSELLVGPFREYWLMKQEAIQILTGRPFGH